MSSIHDIPVQLSFDSTENPGAMLDAIIQELVQLLDDYIQHGAQGAIDIKSLPLSEDNHRQLKERLGKGEITVSAQLAGETEIHETAYAGVWWIRHRNMDGRVIAEHIEVGRVPGIVCAWDEDIRQAYRRLQQERDL